MPIGKNEKMLGAHIDSCLVDEFSKQVDERGQKNKRALAAAVRLWLGLPEAIQARLLNQALEANSLVEVVQQIVDQRIQAGRKAAQELAERQRKKRGRKG